MTSISLDGEYDVYYRGQQRGGAIMQIKNSGSVATGYGMAAGEASKITQITDSKTECNGNDGYTIKIVRTHGTSKFECLNQMSSGDLEGLHFLTVSTSATPWGTVVYKKRDVGTRRRLSSAGRLRRQLLAASSHISDSDHFELGDFSQVQGIDHSDYAIDFLQPFAHDPLFFTGAFSSNGGDSACA
jgi:hypothetical protein